MGWQSEKQFSDQFLDEIKSILGLHLIGEPPIEEDQERNTDLITLRMEPVRIGCRVRRLDYLSGYGDQFTIRNIAKYGGKTELEKIVEGWGQYFFYAFGENRRLERWTLADMNIFRSAYFRHLQKQGKTMGHQQHNKDGTGFKAFRWDAFPCEFIVSSSVNLPNAANVT